MSLLQNYCLEDDSIRKQERLQANFVIGDNCYGV